MRVRRVGIWTGWLKEQAIVKRTRSADDDDYEAKYILEWVTIKSEKWEEESVEFLETVEKACGTRNWCGGRRVWNMLICRLLLYRNRSSSSARVAGRSGGVGCPKCPWRVLRQGSLTHVPQTSTTHRKKSKTSSERGLHHTDCSWHIIFNIKRLYHLLSYCL